MSIQNTKFEGECGFKTHPGKVREHNEDSISANPDYGLWLVADGMGGHQNGALASLIAKQTIDQYILDGGNLIDAIKAAHIAIMQTADKNKDAQGMGSTIVAIRLDHAQYEIAWLGDSRAYLWNGQLNQLTRDHSHVSTLLDEGVISQEEAMHHPSRNLITRCLGVEEPKGDQDADVVRGTFYNGQEILLCSDGLTDELNDFEIQTILALESSAQDRANKLIATAIGQGGSDNISVILLCAPRSAPSAAATNPPQSSSHPRPENLPRSTLSAPEVVKQAGWAKQLKLVLMGVVLAVFLLILMFYL